MLAHGGPVDFPGWRTANSTISPINPCATYRKISPGPTGRRMDPPSSRSAYPDFRRVGGQLRLPPLTNRFRYICPVVSDCVAGQRNWLMYSGRFAMLTPDNVWLTVKPVDMRAGIDTLTQYVQNELNAAWHDGAAFVFTNKARSRIKVLRWDKHGVWLCTRRLHREASAGPGKVMPHGISHRMSFTGSSVALTYHR